MAERLSAAIVFFWLLLAAPVSFAEGSGGPVEVVASIPPLQFLIDRIGGGEVASILLMPQGKDPHTFEPLPRQLAGVARARACFTVGLPFEEKVVARIRAGNRTLAVVKTDAGVAKLPYGEPHAGHGLHGDEAGDPHIWLSPRLFAAMAAKVRDGLAAIRPEAEAVFRRNHDRLAAEIAAVDREIGELLSPYRGRIFYVYHPGFAYFADAYGLRQKAVEEAGRVPSPQHLSALIREAQANRVRVIFVQPQFDRKSAMAVATAIKGSLAEVDTLAYDVLANFRVIAGEFVAAMR